MISNELLVKAGMYEVRPETFKKRLILIAIVSAGLSGAAAYFGFLTKPYYAIPLAVIPPLIYLAAPYLGVLSLAGSVEEDFWAYLASLWILQRVGRALSDCFKVAASIAPRKEAREYFKRVASRIKAAGSLSGLEINMRLSPSRAWSRVYARLHDYLATRGEAVSEMLKVELEDSINRTLTSLKQRTERLMMTLIIYTLTATIFPFVMIMIYSFQALAQEGGVSSGPLLATIATTVAPSPLFVFLFKVFSTRLFYFRKETVAHAWARAISVFIVLFALITYIEAKGISPLPVELGKTRTAMLAMSVGGLAGFVTIRKEEWMLRGQAFDFPMLLQDIFAELRGGRPFSDAVLSVKAPYKPLRDLVAKMKGWAKLRLPYMVILENVAREVRYSVSRLISLLIINALNAGADLEETFATISDFTGRIRELWIDTEGEKMANYLTALLAFFLVVGSYVLLFRILNVEAISKVASETVRSAILFQAFAQTTVIALSLGTVRTGHITSGLRELGFMSLATLAVMMFI